MFETSIYNLHIFKGIEESIIDDIIEKCPREFFKKWKVIIQQWEMSNGKGYIIRSGKVKVCINGKQIAELSTGDIFWEIALLNEESRSATIEAIKELETIVVSQEDIINMINSDENNINKEIMRRIEENLENE